MIPMTVKDAVKAYIKPYLIKETKSAIRASFQCEDGVVPFQLEAPLENGVPQPVDLNDIDSLKTLKVKSAGQSVKNANVALGQTFTKLAPNASEGFVKLLEYANTAAEEIKS